MSPEQINGEEADGRSDLYALGIMMYEALTGEHPINAEKPIQFLVQHILQAPRPLAQMAPDLPHLDRFEQLITPALAKDPTARYPDAIAMRHQVRDVMTYVEPDPDQVWQTPYSGTNNPRLQRVTQGSGVFVRVTGAGMGNTWSETSLMRTGQVEAASLPAPTTGSPTPSQPTASALWHALLAEHPWVLKVVVPVLLALIVVGLLAWALVGGDSDTPPATPSAGDVEAVNAPASIAKDSESVVPTEPTPPPVIVEAPSGLVHKPGNQRGCG